MSLRDVRLRDLTELAFRGLFCLIFVGLGGEHVFDDSLIRLLMPDWVPAPRLVSLLVGLWLMFWGALILLGWRLRAAAIALGGFVVLVTLTVHAPALFAHPETVTAESLWMWDILQRSNFVKNLCLLGVCFHLLHHRPGRFSLEAWQARRAADGGDRQQPG